MILTKISKTISGLNKGVVTDYALYILIGVCFYLSIFTFFSVVSGLVNCITITCVVTLILSRYYGQVFPTPFSQNQKGLNNLVSGFFFQH
jgi:hypothetical protein